MSPHRDPNKAPPANTGLLVLTGILLVIPMLALIPVGWYSKQDPKLGPFPFFVWYQMVWVFLTAGLTWCAYLLVQKARPHQPITPSDEESAVR